MGLFDIFKKKPTEISTPTAHKAKPKKVEKTEKELATEAGEPYVAKWWEFRFCWLPKKCYLTDKPLWGQRAYHGENWVTGPDEPVVEHYWIERDKFVLWQLTRKHYGTI
jgi:hypothetical protein